MTDNMTGESTSAESPAKRPYVAPFLRVLGVEGSGGKAFHSPSETTGDATGPS